MEIGLIFAGCCAEERSVEWTYTPGIELIPSHLSL